MVFVICHKFFVFVFVSLIFTPPLLTGFFGRMKLLRSKLIMVDLQKLFDHVSYVILKWKVFFNKILAYFLNIFVYRTGNSFGQKTFFSQLANFLNCSMLLRSFSWVLQQLLVVVLMIIHFFYVLEKIDCFLGTYDIYFLCIFFWYCFPISDNPLYQSWAIISNCSLFF